MATNTLETPKNTVKFDSLVLLREELGKQTSNPERLGEFQKTIDEALEKGDREGVIEFTEDEWKSMITNEDLPPLEQVKELLKKKIEGMKEIKTESKEKREGIMGELDKKVDEAKKAVEDVTEKATGAVKEALSPLEKIKASFTKMGNSISEMWSSLWTPVKFAWYTIWASLGFKFGKDALAAMTKEKAEKVVEAAKEKTDEIAKKGPETLSKVPALAALSAAAVGMYAVAKKFLPKSVTENIGDGKDGAKILQVLRGRRFLKLFGLGGGALLGAGALFAFLTANPAKAEEELGDMPETAEGKKDWWKKAIAMAGLEGKEEGNQIISYLNGEKIEQKLEQQPLEEGKVWLKNHPLYTNTMQKLENLGNKLLLMQKENPDAFKAALAAIGLVAGAGFVISASTKAVDIARTFLIAATKSAGKHPIMWAGGLIAGVSGLTALAHMQIREDASVDDIREMVGGVFDYDDFKNNIDWMPDLIEAPVDKVADCLRDNGAVLANFISDFCDKFWEKTGQATRDWLILDTHERISSKNTEGLEAFMLDLKVMNTENTKELCGEDKKSGVLGTMISKIKKDEKITEKDIYTMMQATRGTKIRIFPEGGSREEGRFIQFVILDDNDQPIGMAKNICLNPAISESSQEEASREFLYNPHGTNEATKALGDSLKGVRDFVSDLTEAMTAGDMKKSKTMADKILQSGGVLLQAGGNLLLQYGKAMILLPKMAIEQIIPGGKEYNMQEALVEYAGVMLPILAIGAGKKALIGGTWGKVLCDTIRLPYDSTKVGYKIFKRAMKGDLAGIIRDPAVSVKDRFFGRLKSKVPFAEDIRMKGKLQRVRGILEKQKWYKDMDMKDTPQYEALDKELSGIINNTTQEKLRDLIGIKHSNDLSKAKNSIADIDIAIDGINKKLSPEVIAQLREEAAKAAERGNLTNNNNLDDLEKQRNALDVERRKMDDRRLKLEEEIRSGENEGKDMSKQKKRLTEMTTAHNEIFAEHVKVRENIDALARGERPPHVINTGKIGKIKIRGKGLLGVAAVLGAGVVIAKGIDAIKGDSKSYRDKSAADILAEGTPEEDGIDYFGYEESDEDEEDGSIISEYRCETPQEFEKKLDAMSASYSEELSTFFTQVEQGSPATPETINKICDSHEKKVGEVKKLLGENKGMMTAFWKDKFTSPETGEEIIPDDLRKEGFKAFMFIHKNAEGKFLLDTMNNQDLKNVLTQIYDTSDKQDFLKKNLGSTAGTGVDIGLRVAPFTGSAMSGVDAVQDFKNGNISNGFWNVGWCVAGFALDIFTAGTVSTGLRVAKTGAVMAAHTGVLLTGQGIQQYFSDVRSESVSIESL